MHDHLGGLEEFEKSMCLKMLEKHRRWTRRAESEGRELRWIAPGGGLDYGASVDVEAEYSSSVSSFAAQMVVAFGAC